MSDLQQQQSKTPAALPPVKVAEGPSSEQLLARDDKAGAVSWAQAPQVTMPVSNQDEPPSSVGPRAGAVNQGPIPDAKPEPIPTPESGPGPSPAVQPEEAVDVPPPAKGKPKTTLASVTDEDQPTSSIYEVDTGLYKAEEAGINLSRTESCSGSSTANERDHAGDADTTRAAPKGDPNSTEAATDIEAASAPETPVAPAKPYSAFSRRAKQVIILGAATTSVFSPLSMQIYLPSLNNLSEYFDVSRSKVNLTVTVFMIFMGLSPMVVGGLADLSGRRPAMILCFVIYVAACVILALAKNFTTLLVLRMIQSIGSSPTIALASAVVADVTTSAERGGYASLVAIPVIFAPTLGPVIGGLLGQYLGWRSIFWFLCIGGAVALVMIVLFFPETCRTIVGDASGKPPLLYQTAWQMFKSRHLTRAGGASPEARVVKSKKISSRRVARSAFLGSLQVLLTKERFFLLMYVGIVFSGFNAIATALPSQLKSIYGYESLIVGLMFLPMAGGAMVSTMMVGRRMNKVFRKHAGAQGIRIKEGRQIDMVDFPVEHARLEVALPSLALCTAAMTCWGWVLQQRSSIAAPCVLLFFLGAGFNGVMASTNALLMDVTQTRAGAAMAASNMTRCFMGAAASATIQPMIDSVGVGWAYVIWGMIYLGFSPLLAVVWFKSHQWRREAKEKEDRRRERRRAHEADSDDEMEGEVLEADDEPGEGLTSLRFSTLQLTPSRPDRQRKAATLKNGEAPAVPLERLGDARLSKAEDEI